LRETTRFLITRAGITIKRQKLIWDALVDYVRATWALQTDPASENETSPGL
jgi:hypothetical protein